MKAIAKTILLTVALIGCISVSAQQLRVSGTWQNLKAHPAPLLIVGELATKQSDMDKQSFWSVGSETLDRDYADFEQYRQYMKETGVGYARLQSGWAKTEQEKGKYDFSWIEDRKSVV